MEMKVTVEQNALLSMLANLSSGGLIDPDGISGTVNPKGPGGPS